MPITVGSNIASLRAQRSLSGAVSEVNTISERLASGLRINRASDDAAGLSISMSLQAEQRVYSQGLLNANHSISALSIADATLSNLSDIVTRIRELSEQAASGTLGNRQRDSIDAEAQALSKEFFRLTKVARYNGIGLLDGGLADGLSTQLGFGASGALTSRVGGGIGTGRFGGIAGINSGASGNDVATGDLNGDGILDFVSLDGNNANIYLGRGDGTFARAKSFAVAGSEVRLDDLNDDGRLDLVVAGGALAGNVVVRLGNGDGSFSSGASYAAGTALSVSDVVIADLNGDGILDLATVGTGASREGFLSVRLGQGGGVFGNFTETSIGGNSGVALRAGDVNGDGILDLVAGAATGSSTDQFTVMQGLGNGTFTASSTFSFGVVMNSVDLRDVNNDGLLDIVAAGGGRDGVIGVRLGAGSGSFAPTMTFGVGGLPLRDLAIGDLNGDGLLDIAVGGAARGGFLAVLHGNGNGSFRISDQRLDGGEGAYGLELADLNGDGVLDLLMSNWDLNEVGVALGGKMDGVAPLLEFSLKTKADALQAMGMLDSTLARLSDQRGRIGAGLSRLEIATANSRNLILNLGTAESRIRDADVAEEAARFVQAQIRQQIATAILGQANQLPALVLKLLGSG